MSLIPKHLQRQPATPLSHRDGAADITGQRVEEGMREFHDTVNRLRAQVSDAERRYMAARDQVIRCNAQIAMLNEQLTSTAQRAKEWEGMVIEAQAHMSTFAGIVLESLQKLKLGGLRKAGSVHVDRADLDQYEPRPAPPSEQQRTQLSRVLDDVDEALARDGHQDQSFAPKQT